MTDFSTFIAADRGQQARMIHLVDKTGFDDWVKKLPAEDRALLSANRFDAKSEGTSVILPRGAEFEVVLAVENAEKLGPWALAKLAESVPEGTYRLGDGRSGQALLGWLLAQHRFDDYRKAEEASKGPRVLLTGEPATIEPAVRLAQATALVRDLVNRPAMDLGPAQLEAAVRESLAATGADVRVTAGADLTDGYPLVAAVGAGAPADRAPRLIEAEWGNPNHPRVAIVGKGVCFDSGGLDIKNASGMRIMKKDMGGAAHALTLASLIIAERLPLRIHLLIPAVENSVSGSAFRPGDIIRSRQGLNVEIDNTDAEGRLILADALARAAEDEPQLIIDFATLTGAARVALGPDLPALFTNSDELASSLEAAARDVDDPLWRLPLWAPYGDMLKSDIADLANSAPSPMAGAVVAAVFLKRFVPDSIPWAHLDTWAWRDSAKPGRPKGGEALGLRAVHEALRRQFPA
jgi:leucyl aminopeptidase